MDRTANFYSTPSYIHGAGLPIFSGARRQRGGSIFGALSRLFMPIVKSFGKKVVRHGAKQVLGLAKDVVGDALQSRNVVDSVKQHGKRRALDLTQYAANEGIKSIQQAVSSNGSRKSLGKRKRVTKKSIPNKKQRQTTKPLF